VPLTLLSFEPETELAVVELGANKPGEITELCRIARPDSGLITNIGKEHLEGFIDIEGVAKSEGELFDFLAESGGLAFVNLDDPWIKLMGIKFKSPVTYSNLDSEASVFISDAQLVPNIRFDHGEHTFESSLFGSHNLQNITACIAVALHYGIQPEKIRTGLLGYVSSNNRSEVRITDRNKIILDCYNANPSSIEVALQTFAKFQEKNKTVILGDMFELGAESANEHQAIVDLSAGFNF
jgi:UDP-N-acetylmuramoyl-tripeptide--D-alanyl-D-alanine ligase